MGRRKRAKVHVKTGEKNDPPDKKKKVPVQDKMSEEDDETSTPDKEKRSDNNKRKHTGGVSPSPKKESKRNLRRVVDYEDEDWLPESEGSDCSSRFEGDDKDNKEKMNLSDEGELSSEKEQRPNSFKRKGNECVSSPSKRQKRQPRDNVEKEDEDDFAIIPNDFESSSKSDEEDSEPKPQRQLRGTRYIKIRNNVWKIILVRGDGNCLFYTLAYLLGRSPENHRQIRVDIVRAAITPDIWKEIVQDVRNKHFSRPEFTSKTDEELKQLYCNMMIRDGVYASDIEMRVASKLFPFKITYIEEYSDLQPNQNKYRVCDVNPNSDKPVNWIRYSGSYEQGHFEPLDPVGDIEPLSDGGYDDDLEKVEKNKKSNHASTSSKEASQTSQKPENSSITTQPSSSYKCLECQGSFEQVSDFFNHYLKIHSEKIEVQGNSKAGRCPICFQVLSMKKLVIRHILSRHAISKQFKCTTCDKCFTRKDHLKQHQLLMHLEADRKPYACKKCGKSFKTKTNLNEHLKSVHSGERPYACEECGKTFKTKSTLSGHHKTIHSNAGGKPYACEQCGKTFTTKSILSGHQKTIHSNNRPYPCEVCPKDFKTIKELNQHSISHSVDRPFKCKTCTSAFKMKQHLDDHELTHLNHKPFQCDHCGKTFITQNILNRHLAIHKDDRPFVCKLCSKDFKTKKCLKQHSMSHVDERKFKCKICSKGFTMRRNLKGHEQTHINDKPFQCSTCSRSFKRRKALKRHQRLPCATRYPCPQCKNVWFESKGNLTTHLKVHNNRRHCICSTCGKACTSTSYLTIHQKSHDKNRRNFYPYPCLYCSLRCRTNDQKELHSFLHHFDAYAKVQQDNLANKIQVIGPTRHKYILYTVLLVRAKDFPGGTGNDVWRKLCENPGIYDVQFYTGVYSSLGTISVRPGHTQPASMGSSTVYKHHIDGWRCFGATERMGTYVQMRRREAIYIEWAKAINSKSQICINKKCEPLPKQERHHIESLKKSKLTYFCFDKTHCSLKEHGHAIPNTDIPLGLHLHGRLHEMYFNGCCCDTCKILSKQPSILNYLDHPAADEECEDSVLFCDGEDNGSDGENNESNVGAIYEDALNPENITDFEESENDEDSNEENMEHE